MQGADGLNPPQRNGRKKSLAVQENDYDEEDGEHSMQIESMSLTSNRKQMIDEYLGPDKDLANLRPPVTLLTAGRSSIRPLSRTPGLDIDQFPSPRPMSSAHRFGRNGGPGPSGLTRTGSYREPEPPSESPNLESDETRDQNSFDDYGPQEDDSPAGLPRETSFRWIDQDGNEEVEDPEETPQPPRRLEKGKGKSREEWPGQDEGAEDEIATGMGDVDLESESDALRDGRPQKSLKSKKHTVTSDTATKTQRKKENKRMPRFITAHFPTKIAVFQPREKAQDGVNENRSNVLHIGEESAVSMGGRNTIQDPYSFPR